MEIGIGLPSSVRGASGADLVEWAIRGERAGFASLSTLDRIVYDNHDCLTTLAAAAAVTERTRLMTSILIAPLRTNTALLAKQAASIDQLSGGRLVLGMAVGARPDDFAAGNAPHQGRGDRFDEQLAELRRLWNGEPRGFAGAVGPSPVREGGPELILGGHAPRAIRRAATTADGWISGSGGVAMFAQGADAVRTAWREAGRQRRPRLIGLAYFSLGDSADAVADAYLRDYYGFAPPYANAVIANTAVGEDGVVKLLRAYEEAGCDELVFSPCATDVEQVDRLAAVVN